MTIATREEQILRIQATSPYPELNEALEASLKAEVLKVTQCTLESALIEEVQQHLSNLGENRPRRSGYFQRTLNSEYGQIQGLSVPKLRCGNGQRDWQILQRYQRSLGSLLNFCLCLYVMGLSLRDLQEALYGLLGEVLSVSAINRVTLAAQQQMKDQRTAALPQSPTLLLVDGVWVSIQYTCEETWEDQSGHLRTLRRAEERVVLVAMAIWPDGTRQVLHYEVAPQESQADWQTFFEHLQSRGVDLSAIELVVSDGTNGLHPVLVNVVPNAQHQRCITHKVRAMQRHLSYDNLPTHNEQGQAISLPQAKQIRREQIQEDAYAIYKEADWLDAIDHLVEFVDKWQVIEPKAVKTFLSEIALTFMFYDFDESLHPLLRTTNALERLFREFRAKTDEIGAFPNEESCLTLFYLVVQRDHAKHNRLKSVAKNSRH
jgi:transposase-like protein